MITGLFALLGMKETTGQDNEVISTIESVYEFGIKVGMDPHAPPPTFITQPYKKKEDNAINIPADNAISFATSFAALLASVAALSF